MQRVYAVQSIASSPPLRQIVGNLDPSILIVAGSVMDICDGNTHTHTQMYATCLWQAVFTIDRESSVLLGVKQRFACPVFELLKHSHTHTHTHMDSDWACHCKYCVCMCVYMFVCFYLCGDFDVWQVVERRRKISKGYKFKEPLCCLQPTTHLVLVQLEGSLRLCFKLEAMHL